jgi:hypothetical protein
MTESGTRYHAATPEWNKHMVKRILENTKYIGLDGWPEIVPPDVFHSATYLRDAKTCGHHEHPDCNDAVKRKLVCGICGAPFRVGTIHYRSGIRKWRCGSDDCGGALKMTDTELERKITALLNTLIAHPESLETSRVPAPLPLEAERLQNELYREIGKTDWSEDAAKNLAFALAAKRYEALGDAEIISQTAAGLQAKIRQMNPLTAFDRELFCAAVESVIAGADGSLSLKLIGGNILENTDREDYRNADTTPAP